LRIVLKISPAEVSALPWEYLFNPADSQFVCLDPITPVVRDFPTKTGKRESLEVTGPLRILGVIGSAKASEGSQMEINPAEERTAIDEAMKSLEDPKKVDFKWFIGKTKSDLETELAANEYHVLHFIGHGGVHFDLAGGSNQSYIVLQDR